MDYPIVCLCSFSVPMCNKVHCNVKYSILIIFDLIQEKKKMFFQNFVGF